MAVIGLDLDGCAYDFDGTFGDFCARVLGEPREQFSKPLTWHFWEQWGLSKAEWVELFTQYIEEGGFNSAPPVVGFGQATRLLRKHGHRVFIVTARGTSAFGSGGEAQKDTIDWLNRYNIQRDGVIFTAAKQCIGADIFVDDAPHHLEDIRATGKRAIAFDAPYNQEWNGMRVKSWKQAYDVLTALTSPYEFLIPA